MNLVTDDIAEFAAAQPPNRALVVLAMGSDTAGFVLGLPRNMDGSEGTRCQSTRAFVGPTEIAGYHPPWSLPVYRRNEVLIHVAAE